MTNKISRVTVCILATFLLALFPFKSLNFCKEAFYLASMPKSTSSEYLDSQLKYAVDGNGLICETYAGFLLTRRPYVEYALIKEHITGKKKHVATSILPYSGCRALQYMRNMEVIAIKGMLSFRHIQSLEERFGGERVDFNIEWLDITVGEQEHGGRWTRIKIRVEILTPVTYANSRKRDSIVLELKTNHYDQTLLVTEVAKIETQDRT